MAATDGDDVLGATTGGSGAPALEGYLYQVDVSVWTAIDLILAKRLADAVELEPCSQEDIEANLIETDPGKVALGAKTEQRLLVIQAKLRSGEPWTVSSIAALLKHGGPRRVSAKDRLRDATVHYLLVTSAPLTGVALGLSVRQFGKWPKPRDMPRSLVSDLHSGAAGRVAILANEESDRVELRIKTLLTDAFRVPHSKWQGCFDSLRRQARDKMTGRVTRIWSRAELEETIKSFDGYFASSPELNHYVRPTNWSILCQQVMQKYAVVIAGCSGTGKTMAAEALWDHMRAQVPGLERVHVRNGPSYIRTVQTGGPVLFDIEDPWGRYRFEPGSEEWNDKLPTMLHAARADRLFVITTREDVLLDAQAKRSTSPWRVSLEAEHYGSTERLQLYENRIAVLPRGLQVLAVDHRRRVLSELETPLEIQKFFDALATCPDDGALRDVERVQRAIREAHRESIEDTIALQVRVRGAAHWAVIIWGLLKANGKLSRALLPDIQDGLAEHGDSYDQGFEELINFFVAGRSLRQVDSAVSYYHPRVEAGLEGVIKANRVLSRRALSQLCDVLLTFDVESDDDWGRHGAARLIVAASSLDWLRFHCSAKAQATLDVWLSNQVVRDDDQFEDYLRLAARVGSAQCMPAELARFLVDRAPQMLFPKSGWKPIEESDEWYVKVSADPATRIVCNRFVRRMLPGGRGDYPADISKHLTRLAGNLTDAFIQAAMMIVKHGVNMNDDAIADGALADLDAFAPVAEAALHFMHSLEADPDRWDQTVLQIKNGEFSEDYAEHLVESASEDGYSADVLLKAYVSRLRQGRGWQALREHPFAEDLLPWWLRLVCREQPEPPAHTNEIFELAGMAFGSTHEEMLWEILTLQWQPATETRLLDRIVSGHLDSGVRAQAAICLALHQSHQFALIKDKLIASNNIARLIGLFEDLSVGSNSRSYREVGFWEIALRWAQTLVDPYAELVTPFTKKESDRGWTLSGQAGELAMRMVPADENGHLTKIRFGLANGFDVNEDIKTLLASTNDVDTAVAAMDAAVQLNRIEIVDCGLHHTFARVRARALQAIASRTPGILSNQLLAMSSDKGKYVREALVRVIADRLEPEYVDTLLVLAADKWSPWSGNPGGEATCPIAKKAAECLAMLPALPQRVVETVLELAKGCNDQQVRTILFRALAQSGPTTAREELMRLAVSPGRLSVRSGAAYALLNTADLLDEQLFVAIEPDHLARAPEDVAAVLTLLTGLRGTEAMIDAAAAKLSVTGARKVFLVLLGLAARSRYEQLAWDIARLLPNLHVARSLLTTDVDTPLPRIALNDLGDVRAVREVLWLLSHFFEPEPR